MDSINDWILSAIRNQVQAIGTQSGWLEMERIGFTQGLQRTIKHIMSGGTLLLCTDDSLKWFYEYILDRINTAYNDRPFIPIYGLDSSITKLISTRDSKGRKDNDDVYDLLDMSYTKYAFWYIGNAKNPNANFALNKENGLFWILDEKYEFAFTLDSKDEFLDFKLLQMFDLFHKALFGAIFSNFNFND
ncbi:HobA family DNA replication regulator [Helicobacter sp. 11S02629-2]|uniref:HobA family DNA replication regulator n=1 Tax=Helicobacter sp. 11S02629-2 TaxID=1476195 RepID=UPI000BA6A0C9|nr:HobA family DNA replication regulator [Helicobacter sp. 11S02629-2]PAF43499.1 hypothetical protein BKH40_06885 [Helicobacter sp. 11S02629-2]